MSFESTVEEPIVTAPPSGLNNQTPTSVVVPDPNTPAPAVENNTPPKLEPTTAYTINQFNSATVQDKIRMQKEVDGGTAKWADATPAADPKSGNDTPPTPPAQNTDAPPAADANATPAQPDYAAYLKENFGEDFGSVDSIKAQLSELQELKSKPPVPQYASDFVQKLDQAVKAGIDPIDFIATQDVNWDTSKGGVSAMANIHAKMQRDFSAGGRAPSLQEIVLEFDHTYRPDLWMKDYDPYEGTGEPKTYKDFEADDQYGGDKTEIDKAWNAAQRYRNLHDRDAIKAQGENIEYQKKWAVPQTPKPDPKAAQEEKQRSDAAAMKAIKTEAKGALEKLKSFSFQYTDADKKQHTFEFKLDHSKSKTDYEALTAGAWDGSFFDHFSENGKFSPGKLAEALVWLENRDSVVKTAHQSGYTAGRADERKRLKGADFTPQQTNHAANAEIEVPEHIRAQGGGAVAKYLIEQGRQKK
jgi:hypothetical protein